MGFVNLEMICPGAWQQFNCEKKTIQNWNCVTHQSRLSISEEGIIECAITRNKCSRLIAQWHFACHAHPGEYVGFNHTFEYRAALQDMCLTARRSDIAWMNKLLDKIEKLGEGTEHVEIRE